MHGSITDSIADEDLQSKIYRQSQGKFVNYSLPAKVENNLKFPLHMDYLVLF